MTELKLKQIKIESCNLADVEKILVLIQSKNGKKLRQLFIAKKCRLGLPWGIPWFQI